MPGMVCWLVDLVACVTLMVYVLSNSDFIFSSGHMISSESL